MFPTLNFSKVCRPKKMFIYFLFFILKDKKNLNKSKNVNNIIYFITQIKIAK